MPQPTSRLFDALPPRLSAALAAYKNYFFGESELRVLQTVVPRDGLSIDIGAHHGVYTYFLARLSQRVVAYEPNPDLAEYLRHSVRANVMVRESAVGATSGTGFLVIPIIDNILVPGWAKVVETAEQASHSRAVSVVRLDDEGLQNVSFIKIDVEGNEEAVLRGGMNTICRDRPVLLIEIEQRHLIKPISEIFELVEGMGYRGYFLVDHHWRPIVDLQAIQRSNPDRADPESKLYLNNFVFWPGARGNPPW